MTNTQNTPKNRVLVVDDEFSLRSLLNEQLTLLGYEVSLAEDGADALKMLQQKTFDIVITDIKMPRVGGIEILKYVKENFPDTEVIIITAYSDLQTAVDAMKLNAYDFLLKPFSLEQISIVVNRALEKHRLEADNKALKQRLGELRGEDKIIGTSRALKDVLELAKRVAETNSNVLITGESGTGKELVASFIHNNSGRKDNPFVTVNCASLPDNLLESELFGHEKGSFTDAYALKQGLCEIAKNGSLFLDEIGDMSLVIQPKLLRFIETGEFRRVGGTRNHFADVRLIAATNKNLIDEVKSQKFREDLFYRLNVISLHIPPLRDRKEDIPLLIDYFLRTKFPTKKDKYFTPEALNILSEHNWPGNIRELQHLVESVVVLSKSNRIEVNDLPLNSIREVPNTFSKTNEIQSLEKMEEIHITNVLNYFHWNQTLTSKALQISPKTLYLKIKKYSITR